jgi:ankyrin repeat protein
LTETVDALIDIGADLNAPGSRFGGTALRGTALRHRVPVMKLLLEAGADPNRADFNRVRRLHTAVAYGNLDVISMLLQFGASKDAADDVGDTPYDGAAKAGQSEVQNLLLGLAARTKENIQERSQGGRKLSVPHFPDFYGRRSRLDSSIVIKVELGTIRRLQT